MGHVATSGTKKKKAKKAKESSFSGIQETILPVETTTQQEQVKLLEEKAIQDMVPSELQLKEVVEPYGTLSQSLSSSEINTEKAKKSRDSSISRIQETIIPMESIKPQKQNETEREKALQEMIPSETQIKEVVEFLMESFLAVPFLSQFQFVFEV